MYGLIGYVVEVEIKQAGFRPFVLHRQRHELLLQIKRYGGGVSVNGKEAAAGLVVGVSLIGLAIVSPFYLCFALQR